MIIGGEKPSLNQLAHFGVKGMKWGVRSADQPANPNYTTRMRTEDRRLHGKRAVTRINQHLNSGGTRDEALRREYSRDAKQYLAFVGAAAVARLLAVHGSTVLSDIAANRAASNADDSVLKIGSAAEKLKYVKPRGGVHNITTMK